MTDKVTLVTETDVQVIYDTYKDALSGTILRHVNGNVVICEQILSEALLRMKQEKASYNSLQFTMYVWMLRIIMDQIELYDIKVKSEDLTHIRLSLQT